MSVHKRRLPSGRVVYTVRWREGTRMRGKNFDRRADASAFDVETKRRLRLGEAGLLDGRRRALDEVAREWWRDHAEPHLAPKTRDGIARVLDRHVMPYLGALELREIRPTTIDEWAGELRRRGVGVASVRKAMSILQQILGRAVLRGDLDSNPVLAVRKPRQSRTAAVEPPPPLAVERVRAAMLAAGSLRDATLVSVLAYAGLRPGEALALEWRDVGERTLHVRQAVSLGEVKETKTRSRRSVDLLAPLAADLREWHLACGRPSSGFVFPRADGGPWTDGDEKNWTRRAWRPAIAAAFPCAACAGSGSAGPRTCAECAGWGSLVRWRRYDLRHAFVSLLVSAGASVVEVAHQAGHSPTMTLGTYAHVIAELRGAERVDPTESIRRAREHVRVQHVCTSARRGGSASVASTGADPAP